MDRKFIVIAVTLFLCQAGWGHNESLTLGAKDNSFYYENVVSYGDTTCFMLQVPMNLVIHTYTPIGAFDPLSRHTTISVFLNGASQPYANSTLCPERTYTDEPEKGYLVIENAPAGNYAVCINGSVGSECNLSLHGYPLGVTGSMSGSESSLAIDAGYFGDSFHFSHQRLMSSMPYKYEEDLKARDLHYNFTLTKPMYVVIDHWGSPLSSGLPMFQGAYTRLHLYRRDALRTKIASRRGSSGVVDSLIAKNWIIELDNSSIKEAAWQGWLPAGDYAVLTENGYLEGASVTTYYDGVIRTQIHGLNLKGTTSCNPIEDTILVNNNYHWEDHRRMDYYPSDSLFYQLTMIDEGDLLISANEGLLLTLHDESGSIIKHGIGSIILQELKTGTYSLVVYGHEDDIRTINIRRIRLPRNGQLASSPIEIGTAPFSFTQSKSLRYYSNGREDDSDINYRFTINNQQVVVFDHLSSESDSLLTTLKSADSTLVFSINRPQNDFFSCYLLNPGTYIYTVSSRHPHTKLFSGIRSSGGDVVDSTQNQLSISETMNYIVSYEPRTSNTNQATHANSQVSVSYYDLLGRPRQIINVAHSPFGGDVGSLQEYSNGLESDSWGPFTIHGGRGSFQSLPNVRELTSLLNHNDTSVYIKKQYENNTIHRLTSVTGAGQLWHDAGKESSKTLLVNENSGILSCPLILFNGYAQSFSCPNFTNQMWEAEQLLIEKVNDEDDRTVLKFYDSLNKIILERRVQNDTLYADTYYCYDAAQRLAVVIPPEAMHYLSSQATFSDAIFKKYCWAYTYDNKGRCVCKMEPGFVQTRYIYSRSGEVIFTQNNLQHTKNEWLMTIPDIFGRETIRAIVNAPSSLIESYIDSGIHAVFDESATTSFCYHISDGVLPPALSIQRINWYDNYHFQDLLFGQFNTPYDATVSSVAHNSIRSRYYGEPVTSKGLLTGSYIRVLDESSNNDVFNLRIIGYDHYGRQTLLWEHNHLGGYSVYGILRDFQGNTLSEEERHSGSGLPVVHLKGMYLNDFTGRKVQSLTLVNGDTLALRQFSYTEKGELETVRTHTRSIENLCHYEYNSRGWLLRKKDGILDTKLHYESPEHPSAIQQWAGNVSQWISKLNVSDYQIILPIYDKLNRLDEWLQYPTPTSIQPNVRQRYSHDLNGNIKSLSTNNEHTQFYYDGNRNIGSSLSSMAFSYDTLGRVTYDPISNLSIYYNDLGLPKKYTRNGTTLAYYSYLADGTKVSALNENGNGIIYLGSSTYRKNGNSLDIESVGWEGGKIVAFRNYLTNTLRYIPVLYNTDHLGSVRAAIDGETGIAAERSNYSPYGAQNHLGTAGLFQNNAALRDHFESKEDQGGILGEPFLDFGTRVYNPATKRWYTPDPMGEKYYSLSPYIFCASNPLNYIDKEGNDIVIAGKNKSSITVKTDLIDYTADVSKIGIDWGGKYELSGTEYLSVALDLAGVVDQSGISDALNASVQFASGEYWDGAISVLATFPVLGDVSKLTRISKDIRLINNAIESLNKNKKWSKSLRSNMIQVYGEPPKGMHAHHILPKKFEKSFEKAGIDINNPKYGMWLDAHLHLSKAADYNIKWDNFFLLNTNPNLQEVEEEAVLIMRNVYGK